MNKALCNVVLAQVVPYKSVISMNDFVRLGNVLLCTSCKLCRSGHNAVFPVEGQVIIDRTFSERKRENSLKTPFCII